MPFNNNSMFIYIITIYIFFTGITFWRINHPSIFATQYPLNNRRTSFTNTFYVFFNQIYYIVILYFSLLFDRFYFSSLCNLSWCLYSFVNCSGCGIPLIHRLTELFETSSVFAISISDLPSFRNLTAISFSSIFAPIEPPLLIFNNGGFYKEFRKLAWRGSNPRHCGYMLPTNFLAAWTISSP